MTRKFKLRRTVTPNECGWLDAAVVEGTVVQEYSGHTYGCVGTGMAVEGPGIQGFTELPRDALEPV